MTQEGKKISFGFSKIIKKPELKIYSKPVIEKKVDYIEYVDDKSIKVIGEEVKKEGPLIIPMLGSKSWHDRIINKINADIYGDKKDKGINEKEIKKEPIEPTENDDNEPIEISTNIIKSEESKNPPALSLEDQAAQEIIHDLKKEDKVQENGVNLVIDQIPNLAGEQEPTLENYEEIPIEKYGMAMLRGMGWEPDKGIGKNAQIVKAIIPTIRPKGIGLGADKVMQQKKAPQNQTKNGEKLKLGKGSFVKITASKHGDHYGIVEGFDDDSGRIIVKLALTNKIVSLNEGIVELVTKVQYEKNSRVLNASMYEKYKDKIADKSTNKKKNKSSSEESENDERVDVKKSKNHKTSIRKNQRSKEREKYSSSSEDSSDSDEKHKKRNKSNDWHENHHKSKKSKKHCHRDHSESSSKSKKSHKKDKKREKSDKNEKKKHRKHKRSRSRSESRSSRR